MTNLPAQVEYEDLETDLTLKVHSHSTCRNNLINLISKLCETLQFSSHCHYWINQHSSPHLKPWIHIALLKTSSTQPSSPHHCTPHCTIITPLIVLLLPPLLPPGTCAVLGLSEAYKLSVWMWAALAHLGKSDSKGKISYQT